MKKEGFLLDVGYITEKDDAGKEKPVIRLWCKDKEGENFVVIDKNFEPYFYAIPYTSQFYAHEGDAEEKKQQVEKIRIYRDNGTIKIKRVEFCQRKLLGVNQKVLKIFMEHPRHVPLLREVVRKEGFTVLEADILFAIRYLIDKQLRPFDGVAVEGEEIALDYADTAILTSNVSYKKMAESDLPELKIMSFDCEMAASVGMPSPNRDPIIIISVAYHAGNEVKAKLFVMSDEEFRVGDDRKVLNDFFAFVADHKPEIIVGYNSDSFDWPYIKERANKHNIRMKLGADGSTVQYEKGRALPGVNITGMLNVDLFKLAKRDLDSVKVKTLENVSEFLGVMNKDERVNLSPREITECWYDSSTRERLYEYAKADAVSTLGIATKVLPLQIELSKMVGYPLDELAKMGRGRQVESFLTLEAFKKGELVPPKSGGEKTFEGGFVLPPVKGLHEDVIALDFSSMYPTIMISFNVSPDTFVDSREATGEDLYIAPEVGHAFKKSPDGFFKRIMSDLITRRRQIKADMNTHAKNSAEYQLLDIRQQSIKILTNSFYGYTGWSAAKFYKRECAEATTAWGRYFIKRTVEVAEELGLEVIYGDTDSVFAKLSTGDGVQDTRDVTREKARAVSEKIATEFPLELELQDFFKAIFFTGKKKRYAALTDKDEILVRGLEVRRGDWCEQAKEMQTEVIDMILRQKDPGKAAKYVKNVIHNFKDGKVPLQKLIIHKTLTRKISAYETKQAHVIAAERALTSSFNLEYEVGSKIPYVIIKGGGKTSDRAFPVDIIERSAGLEIYAESQKYLIDVSYYVHHQLIPVAHRVLQLFGYEVSSFEDVGQKTLGQWF